jgi:8-oxo-dGTP pyrophosphatase MutT (NUDIX family)
VVDRFVRDTEHDRYPVAVHVVLTDPADGRVLLMRRDGTDYGRNKLAFVAGHVDMGETVTECAVRESAEEIGVTIDPNDLVPAGVMFRRSAEPRVDFFFSVSRWAGDPHIREPHKCSELVWAAPDSLPDDVLDFVPRALANRQQRRSFDEFGWDVPSVLPA